MRGGVLRATSNQTTFFFLSLFVCVVGKGRPGRTRIAPLTYYINVSFSCRQLHLPIC
jgi:hypothetical protein